MGKKLLLFFIIIAFLVSCSNEINSQTVFFEWQGQGIWLETESLNMEKAIIVADDSMIIRNIIERAIGEEYIVLNAGNGKEAIKHITDPVMVPSIKILEFCVTGIRLLNL